MLAGPHMEEEGLLVADIDLSDIVFLKYACDSVGHYARPDILRLATNLKPQPVAQPFGASVHAGGQVLPTETPERRAPAFDAAEQDN